MTPSVNGMNLYERVEPFYKELVKIEKDLKKHIKNKSILIAVTPGVPLSIISYIKSIVENNNDGDYNFSYADKTANDVDLKCYYDIVISEANIGTSTQIEVMCSYDIYFVYSNINKQENTIYHHEFQEEAIPESVLTHEINTSRVLKKISETNLIELIFKIKYSNEILISTKPFLEIIDISKNQFRVEKKTSKNIFICSRLCSDKIKKAVNMLTRLIEQLR